MNRLPDLEVLRQKVEEQIQWIETQSPEAMKRNFLMDMYGLTEAEANSVVTFIMLLKGSRESMGS